MSGFSKFPDLALLTGRAGTGLLMMYLGFPKITGGPEYWEGLGKATRHLGVDFLPVVWGLAGASAEFIGGALLALGFYSRWASIFLIAAMLVATVSHFGNGENLYHATHALHVAFACVVFLFVGPGKYSINQK